MAISRSWKNGRTDWANTTPKAANVSVTTSALASGATQDLLTITEPQGGLVTDIAAWIVVANAELQLVVDGVVLPLTVWDGTNNSRALLNGNRVYAGTSTTTQASVYQITGPIAFKSTFVVRVLNNAATTLTTTIAANVVYAKL